MIFNQRCSSIWSFSPDPPKKTSPQQHSAAAGVSEFLLHSSFKPSSRILSKFSSPQQASAAIGYQNFFSTASFGWSIGSNKNSSNFGRIRVSARCVLDPLHFSFFFFSKLSPTCTVSLFSVIDTPLFLAAKMPMTAGRFPYQFGSSAEFWRDQ